MLGQGVCNVVKGGRHVRTLKAWWPGASTDAIECERHCLSQAGNFFGPDLAKEERHFATVPVQSSTWHLQRLRLISGYICSCHPGVVACSDDVLVCSCLEHNRRRHAKVDHRLN